MYIYIEDVKYGIFREEGKRERTERERDRKKEEKNLDGVPPKEGDVDGTMKSINQQQEVKIDRCKEARESGKRPQ